MEGRYSLMRKVPPWHCLSKGGSPQPQQSCTCVLPADVLHPRSSCISVWREGGPACLPRIQEPNCHPQLGATLRLANAKPPCPEKQKQDRRGQPAWGQGMPSQASLVPNLAAARRQGQCGQTQIQMDTCVCNPQPGKLNRGAEGGGGPGSSPVIDFPSRHSNQPNMSPRQAL